MPTLHNVTENTKKLLKYGGIFIVILVALVLLYRGSIFVKDMFFPTPVDPPNVAFGKLPPVIFPEGLPSNNLTFVVDTISGDLPTYASEEGEILDRMNVYKIYNPEFSLLDLQNAKTIVASVGFTGREVPLGNNVYLWNTTQAGLEKTIEMNIVNKNFTYASTFRTSPQVLTAQRVPTRDAAITSVKRFLNSMTLFPSDINDAKTKTQLLTIDGTELIAAEESDTAQVVRVSFFQNDINNFPIFYTDVPYSSIDFFVTGGNRSDAEIVQGTFYHQLITSESGTYPLKSVEQAFKELQDGKGYIGSNFIEGNEIKIKEVVLGYYASDSFQEYLTPIYIFKGLKDEFYAYVNAIPNEWFRSVEPTED